MCFIQRSSRHELPAVAVPTGEKVNGVIFDLLGILCVILNDFDAMFSLFMFSQRFLA